MYVQNEGEIVISAVLPLSKRVNANTDKERETIITNGRRLFFVSVTEPAKITGSNGNMHGARTVRIPATKETMNKIMTTLYYMSQYIVSDTSPLKSYIYNM